MNQKLIEASLIEAGIKNLQEFGYPECNKENIFTDMIYRACFRVMLNDAKGKAGYSVDKTIDALIARIDKQGDEPVEESSTCKGE